MTINITHQGKLERQGTTLTTTSRTTVFTANAGIRPLVLGIRIANTTGSAVTAIVEWYDAANTTYYQLTGTKSIAANDTYTDTFTLPLLDSDTISVTAGTGSSALDVTVVALANTRQ